MGKNIEIYGGRGNRKDHWDYVVSYCGVNKEGKTNCNFYNINIEKLTKNLYSIKRGGLNSSEGDLEKINEKAYSISKNIAKLFHRDLVPNELKEGVQIIDRTFDFKPLNLKL